jgi:hypothetical protein
MTSAPSSVSSGNGGYVHPAPRSIFRSRRGVDGAAENDSRGLDAGHPPLTLEALRGNDVAWALLTLANLVFILITLFE